MILFDPALREIGFLLVASVTLGMLFIRTYVSLLELYGEERQVRQEQRAERFRPRRRPP